MSPFSQAMIDYYYGATKGKLWVETSYGTKEVMPFNALFRSEEDFSDLELFALSLCHGKVLDIGAGVGAYAIVLQNRGLKVLALEIEQAMVNIMIDKGVKQAVSKNIFDFESEPFDTLFMMMNGIGLVGTIAGLEKFLEKAKSLMFPDGRLLLDSSDISYLYQDLKKPQDRYFGEVSYRYIYNEQQGNWFNWLYIDAAQLQIVGNKMGWNVQVLFTDETDQYLARLSLK